VRSRKSGPSTGTTWNEAASDWISRRKSSALKRPWPWASGGVFEVVTTAVPAAKRAARNVFTMRVLPGSSSSNSSMQSSSESANSVCAACMPIAPIR